MNRRLDPSSPAPIALALSGGSDSVALLHLAHAWTHRAGRPLLALSVDHGLHPESGRWTAAAGEAARALGAVWRALPWLGPKPATGLPAAARAARHALLADAARESGACVVLLGHTADDVAESEMIRGETPSHGRMTEWSPSPAWPEGRGVFLLRPLLSIRRAALQAWLTAQGASWLDDPANDDPRYARTRARLRIGSTYLPASCSVGLRDSSGPGPERDRLEWRPLTSSAHPGECWDPDQEALRAVNEAPYHHAAPYDLGPGLRRDERDERPDYAASAEFEGGAGLTLEIGGLLRSAHPQGVLAKTILCASGRSRPAPGEALARALERLADSAFGTCTLGGAHLRASGERLRVTRELGRRPPASLDLPQGAATVFDGRFELTANAPGLRAAALAGHAAALPRADRDALRAIPADCRPALPVLLAKDVAPRLPAPFGTGRAETRPLASARLRAALGCILDEQTLRAASQTASPHGVPRALILS